MMMLWHYDDNNCYVNYDADNDLADDVDVAMMKTHMHKTHFEMCNCWSSRLGRKPQTLRILMIVMRMTTTIMILTLLMMTVTSFFPNQPGWRFSLQMRRSEQNSEGHNLSFGSVPTIEPRNISTRITGGTGFDFFWELFHTFCANAFIEPRNLLQGMTRC